MMIPPEDAGLLQKESRTLIQKLKDNDPKIKEELIAVDEPIPDFPEEEHSDWKINVDLRAAQNLTVSPIALDADDPLVIGMPSTFVEISYSPTLLYVSNSDLKQFSETCNNTNSPNWNQLMTLEGDFEQGQETLQGSFWLKIFDQ